MFNRKSIYALNKKDPNAIVYTDADGNLIRLTRDDFSNEEEFLRWKKISDMDYHGEEKVDHLYYDGTLPLESLAEEVIAVPPRKVTSQKLTYPKDIFWRIFYWKEWELN